MTMPTGRRSELAWWCRTPAGERSGRFDLRCEREEGAFVIGSAGEVDRGRDVVVLEARGDGDGELSGQVPGDEPGRGVRGSERPQGTAGRADLDAWCGGCAHGCEDDVRVLEDVVDGVGDVRLSLERSSK